MSLVVAGCATGKAKQMPTPVVQRTYQDVSARALVFDPPVTYLSPQPSLSREGRELQAYVGYDELDMTTFDIYTDDRQSPDGKDRYVREAFIHHYGVRTR